MLDLHAQQPNRHEESNPFEPRGSAWLRTPPRTEHRPRRARAAAAMADDGEHQATLSRRSLMRPALGSGSVRERPGTQSLSSGAKVVPGRTLQIQDVRPVDVHDQSGIKFTVFLLLDQPVPGRGV